MLTMKQIFIPRIRFRERGQSLVETALILPLMVILIAGVVEVSNIMITKNRIETAARAAARFASQGGVAVEQVALNAVTDTLDLSSGVWNIWLVNGTMNDTGTDFTSWQADGNETDSIANTPIYGVISTTTAYTDVVRIIGDCVRDPDPVDWNSPGANKCVRDQVLAELRDDVTGVPSAANNSADVQIVGVYISHDVPSILGLSSLPAFSGILSVTGFSVMRTTSESSEDATLGCLTAAPIGFDSGVRSITQSVYDGISFTYPATSRPYGSFKNIPDQELAKAQEGYLYLFRGNQLQYVWPKWNSGIASGSGTLADSLTPPGNTFNYFFHAGDPGAAFDPPGYVIRGFVNVNDSLDRSMHVGDFVSVNESASLSDGNVQTIMQNHIDTRRGLRIVMLPNGGGAPKHVPPPDNRPYYVVDGFAVFRIVGYSTNENWILAEFLNWDDSCGQ